MFTNLIVSLLLSLLQACDTLLDLIIPKQEKQLDHQIPDRMQMHSRQMNPSDPASPYRSVVSNELYKLDNSARNLYQVFRKACETYGHVKTMGVREVLRYEDEVQENGKVFRKSILADEYTWSTNKKSLMQVDELSNGLLKLGLKSNDKVVIFSETKPEWLISAFACFRIKAPIVTLYATLGKSSSFFFKNFVDLKCFTQRHQTCLCPI